MEQTVTKKNRLLGVSIESWDCIHDVHHPESGAAKTLQNQVNEFIHTIGKTMGVDRPGHNVGSISGAFDGCSQSSFCQYRFFPSNLFSQFQHLRAYRMPISRKNKALQTYIHAKQVLKQTGSSNTNNNQQKKSKQTNKQQTTPLLFTTWQG